MVSVANNGKDSSIIDEDEIFKSLSNKIRRNIIKALGDKDKLSFTFASYNAGFQNIIKAQKKAKIQGLNENLWHNIKSVAPKVSGWRHKETVGYVDKITTMMK